jgi:hypothetical protein
MFYGGRRKSLVSGAYGVIIDVLESTGWTWEEYLAQPADLIDEMETRMVAKAKVSAENAAKMKAKSTKR